MNQTLGYGYPSSVAPCAGRIVDVDGHEWLPPELWVEEFGEVVRPMAELAEEMLQSQRTAYFKDSLIEQTDELNPNSVWKTKGPWAPGAYDMSRRLDVLDYTGVRSQLVFPGTLALYACFMHGFADDPTLFSKIPGDRREYAATLLRAYNNWVIRKSGISSRLRLVAALVAPSPEELIGEARRLIEAGVRAVWLPSSILPGDRSPAHNDLDPFWDLCSRTDTIVTLHIGNEPGFYKTLRWREAKAFEGWKVATEINADPWTLVTQPVPSQNYLTAMVTGAVFERHPRLRLGVIELGADWIGPLAYRLDMWYRHSQFKKWNELLSRPPSEYIRENVRVSAYPFEQIDEYIQKFGLEEIYCYASDFPHVEGGTSPMSFWAERLARLGPGMLEKFFVTNGQFLVPD